MAMQRGEAGEGAETRPGTGWACRTGAGTAWPPPLPWMPPPSAPPPCSVDAGGGFFERAGAKEEQMATASRRRRARHPDGRSARPRVEEFGPKAGSLFTAHCHVSQQYLPMGLNEAPMCYPIR